MSKLNKIKAFIFDLDGVFYKGNKTLHGGVEIVSFLKEQNIPFIFYTNNSTHSIEEYFNKLFSMDILINRRQIVTSSLIAKNYITNKFKDKTVRIFGSESLINMFTDGVISTEPDIVLVGMNNSFTLETISKIRTYANMGKQIIFTNPDILIPVEEGYNFECGAIIKLIENYCKLEPIIIGKPYAYGFEYIKDILGILNQEEIAMVGDTYETDIEGALRADLTPILINSNNYEILNENILTFESLFELLNYLKIGE